MQWKGRRQSENVEDRRGGARRIAVGGGLSVLAIALIALLFGQDPTALLDLLADPAAPGGAASGEVAAAGPEEQQLASFVKVVLADTEDVWEELFRQRGEAYEHPTLVLFRDEVRSACGFQESAVGPFYCPLDRKVYLDLGFFEQLASDLAAPGDFAQAYVIAHEVGHHVQNLLGTSDEVQREQRALSAEEANQLSVRLELQADFLAGLWAHHAQRAKTFLDPGDVEEALRAASRIGDDTLQERAGGRVMPESFTHGTAAQRVRWFRRGFERGDWELGDTFALPYDEL
jgi:predicted metalloprotease